MRLSGQTGWTGARGLPFGQADYSIQDDGNPANLAFFQDRAEYATDDLAPYLRTHGTHRRLNHGFGDIVFTTHAVAAAK